MDGRLASLEITNFRSFQHLVLEDLADVNLIVGRNNVGKTAILEAALLLGRPCHVDTALNINQGRGLARTGRDTVETFGLHFHDGKTDSPIVISGVSQDGEERTLSLRCGPLSELYPERLDRDNEPKPKQTALLQQRAIRFDYHDTTGQRAWALATVVMGEVGVVDTTELPPVSVLYLASTWRFISDLASVYSDLVVEGLEDEVLAMVRTVFPDVTRMHSLLRGDEMTLFLTGNAGRPLPVQVYGDGATRVLSWLLMLMRSDHTIFLIDEIDTGLHYAMMEPAFRVLLQVAAKRNIQILATTHSDEAIGAFLRASETLGADQPSLQVTRLDRIGKDVVPVRYPTPVLEAALEMGSEVR